MHDDLVRDLAATPDVIADVLESLPEAAWTVHAIAGEWSIGEIIGHVRAADAIWTPRIWFALVDDGVTMPDVDERVLQDMMRTAEMDVGEQVTLYAFGRAELCAALRVLNEDQWSHTFTHAARRGAMAVVDACTDLAGHEAEHLVQLRQVAEVLRESFSQ